VALLARVAEALSDPPMMRAPFGMMHMAKLVPEAWLARVSLKFEHRTRP